MIDREGSEQQLRRWRAAEEARDALEARLDRLDALERAGLAAEDAFAERRRLDDAIQRADAEVEEAEIAYHRAFGDHEVADNLAVDREERHLIRPSGR